MATKTTTSRAPKKAPSKAGAPKNAVCGRPTVFRKEYIEVARNLILTDLTLLMLAEKLGVVTSTISKWMLDHPAFSDAITRVRRTADDHVN